MRAAKLRHGWWDGGPGRRFRDDRAGVASIEFALILPIALAILTAEFSLCDAMTAKRKLTISNHTVADLVARQTSVTSSGLGTIMNATAQVMAPYGTSSLTVVVSELTTDSSGHTTVTWSSGLNTAGLTVGAAITPPNGVAQNSSSIIWTTATYTYTPTIGYLFGTMIFTDQFYENPRTSSSIPYSS
jgi:Flp pilus assembly protein TadG